MNILFSLVITIIIALLFLLIKNILTAKKINSSVLYSIIMTIICSLFLVYIIINPKEAMNFTLDGAKLFFRAVFPSLFSFLVIINLIIFFGGVNIYSKLLGPFICRPFKLPPCCSLVLITSLFCGYPLGARYASDLYEKNMIDKDTYERLLNIASNGSPLFILGSVGTAMLGNPILGYVLLISNALSCIIMGLFLSIGKKTSFSRQASTNTNFADNLDIGTALKKSLEDALKTTLSIGSFVVVFSLIAGIIKSNAVFCIATSFISNVFKIPLTFTQSIILGIIEVTNGCSLVSLSSLGENIKIILSSFLITFSGLSITAQVYSIVCKYKVNFKKYVVLKIIQGIISSCITFTIYNTSLFRATIQTFSHNTYESLGIYKPSYLFLTACVLFIVPGLLSKLKKLLIVHS